MSVMKVLPYPNPFLRQRAQDVERFDESLRQLVADMEETMDAEDGIGLAATQVGIDLRLLILAPYAFEGEEGVGKPNLVVINPELIWESDETEVADEGCLSFPELFADVARPDWIKVRYLNEDGEEVEVERDGLWARCFQHELDHLDGRLLVDHLTQKQLRKMREELNQIEELGRQQNR